MQIIGAKISEYGCDNQSNNMATVGSVSDVNFQALVYLGI